MAKMEREVEMKKAQHEGTDCERDKSSRDLKKSELIVMDWSQSVRDRSCLWPIVTDQSQLDQFFLLLTRYSVKKKLFSIAILIRHLCSASRSQSLLLDHKIDRKL